MHCPFSSFKLFYNCTIFQIVTTKDFDIRLMYDSYLLMFLYILKIMSISLPVVCLLLILFSKAYLSAL